MTDVEIEWKPFSLTHVEYPRGDNFGLFLAICSLLPISVIIAFIALILFRRDLHTISFFIGILLNESMNLVLKTIIAQPRPLHRLNLYTDFGMPSSHSQLSWFFATYCIFFIVFRLRHIPGSSFELLWKFIVGVGLIVTASLVSYSRVYLHYHSVSQISWGAIIGVFFALFWFFVVHIILSPIFPSIALWRISEFLMIRDTSLIPNILWFEYTHARAENRARKRKLISMKSQ